MIGTPLALTSSTVRSTVPSPPRLTARSAARCHLRRGTPSCGRPTASASSASSARLVAVVGSSHRATAWASTAASARPWWATNATRLTGRAHGAHGSALAAGAWAWTNSSRLPSAPRRGDSIQPMMLAPAASSAAATSRRTRSWTAGSRIDAPALRRLGPARLELGLHQQHEVGPGPGAGQQSGQHGAQRDEREIGHHDVHRAAEVVGVQAAHVGPLAVVDPRVGPQPLVELAVADVDRHDLSGAALQHAVGEAAGRSAGIQDAPASDVDTEAARAPRRACRRRG